MNSDDGYEYDQNYQGYNPLEELEREDLTNAMGILGARRSRRILTYEILNRDQNKISWEEAVESLEIDDFECTNTEIELMNALFKLEGYDFVDYEEGEYVEMTDKGIDVIGGIYEAKAIISSREEG